MKGVIFNVFEEFLNKLAGPRLYEDLICEVHLETQEPFVGPGTYPDQDLMALFTAAVTKLGVPPTDALKSFGEHLFTYLITAYPHYADKHDLFSFLLTIHDIIHVEVHKLYPNSITPSFTYEQISADALIMTYDSPRRLWHLAQGLIQGASIHFKEKVNITIDPLELDLNKCRILIHRATTS